MDARLFVIPSSHPSIAAALMLERKGIAYKRTDLLPVISKVVLRLAGFPGVTVPALRLDGARVQGSRPIARELDRQVPLPPLFPSDPAARMAVEEAERFGDEELQHPIRQLLWWGFKHDKEPLRSYSEGAKIGLPIGLAMKTAAPIVALSARFNEADDASAQAALAALPGLLDRVDAFIAAGTIGGEEPNAADFQIATSIGLALTMADLRPAIEGRPVAALAERIVPDYPGHTPPVFPAAWLDVLSPAAA
ncbi:MAG TPA: glutathione S-transferase N-terminal domain-containing protein [Solirubrobacterales bacterium]|jgi:glutathione S-transferase